MKPIAYLITSLLILGCGSNKNTTNQKIADFPSESRWCYNEKNSNITSEESYKNHITLNHKSRFYYGFDGNNLFYGTFSEHKSNFAFSEISSIKIDTNKTKNSWSKKIIKTNKNKIKKEQLISFQKESDNINFEPYPFYQSTITEKYWKLSYISKTKVPELDENIYFRLRQELNEVVGYNGCNDFFGSYNFDLENNKLSFGELARTKKSCLNNNFSENEILQIFSNCQYFIMIDDYLLLLDETKSLIAIFESVYF